MQKKNSYIDNGFLILKNFFNDEEMKHLGRLVERIFTIWSDQNRRDIDQGKLVNMHSLTLPTYFKNFAHERLQFFQAIAAPKLITQLDSMFGSKIQFHNSQLFFNPPDRNQAPYWHRDLQFSPIADRIQKEMQLDMLNLHVRIPLLKEQGVFLIPGTHKRWDTELERKVRFELENCRKDDELPDQTLIQLAVGDILIFNAQMIHRGHYLLDESRCALDLCLGESNELVAGSLNKAVLPDKTEMAQIESNQWFERAWHSLS